MRAYDLLHTRSTLRQNGACLELVGELDLATAALVDQAVTVCLTGHPSRLELDLTALTFCDATGLRALLRARRAAHAQHTDFQLTGVPPRLRTILAQLQAGDLLPTTRPASGAAGH